jgi:hypothetical protein
MTTLAQRVAMLEQAAAEAADVYRLAAMAVSVARATGIRPSQAASWLRRLWELDNRYQWEVLGLTPEEAVALPREAREADEARFVDWLLLQLDYADAASVPERERRILRACVDAFGEQFGEERAAHE